MVGQIATAGRFAARDLAGSRPACQFAEVRQIACQQQYLGCQCRQQEPRNFVARALHLQAHAPGNQRRTAMKSGTNPSRKTKAVIALMESGMTDYATIARAVGASVDDVEHIDSASDERIRQLAIRGNEAGFVFNLRKAVACPGCGHRINIVPCLTCQIDRANRDHKRRNARAAQCAA